jgi:hypothetical protein
VKTVLAILTALFVAGLASAQIHVDAYIDFETSSAGTIVTPTIVSNSVRAGGSAFNGYNVYVNGPSTPGSASVLAITNIEGPALPGPVSVGGTVIQPSHGTRCLYTQGSVFEEAAWLFAGQSHVVISYMWRPGFGGSGDFNFYDEVTIQDGGDFSVNSFEMNGNTSQHLKTHNQNGTPADPNYIDLTGKDNNGYWYFVSQEYNGGHLTQIALYNPTNMAPIGLTNSLACNNSSMTSIKFGMNHSPNNVGVPAFNYYDNIIFAVGANAVFPLIPTNSADCLIADHRTDWTTAGVRGGVPTVSTIYTNFYSTNYWAQIQTGINNCPSNQVVKLNGGPYTLTNFLDVLNGVVLRGDGPTNTVLNYIGGGFEALRIRGSATINPPPNNVTWTNGYTAGSTNLFFSSVPNLAVGQAVILVENPDLSVVSPSGSDVPADYSGMLGNSTLIHQQIVVVTAITTNTMVTVFPPIYATNWLSSLSPQAFWLGSNTSIRKAGIENLCIDTSAGSPSYNILVQDSVDCWLKNVESRSGNLAHVYWFESTCGEIRECYFHIDTSYGTSSYGVYLYCSSAIKVEDNITYEVTGPIRLATASGNVIGYNYLAWPRYDSSPHFLNEGIKTHGGHPDYNLYEGNEFTTSTNGAGVYFDNTHGSSSHNTAFRNDCPGWDTNMTDNTFAIGVMCSNRWENIINNVLGVKSYHTNYATPPSVAPSDIFMLGYSNTAWTLNGYDLQVTNSILIHGNQDTVTSTNGGIVYTAGLSTVFSNSYYYASTPSWWDASRWPGVGSDLTVTNFTPNPAMTRFAAMNQAGTALSIPNTSLGSGTVQTLQGGTLIQNGQ